MPPAQSVAARTTSTLARNIGKGAAAQRSVSTVLDRPGDPGRWAELSWKRMIQVLVC